ncbi:MAG: nitroreductase family protein [Gammaproteobacteria bacterium]|nr:nitroreductase family protein [Gammaproteobacteria bacterium]
MHDDPGLFECMYSMRAMRRLRPDPVPEAMVERILEAATRAPSGQNTQPWAFVVVTEEAGRRFFGEQYRYWMRKLSGGRAPAPDDRSKRAREIRAARHLGDHMPDVPLLILACGKRDWPFAVPEERRVGHAPPSYGSVYPAVQNLLLACRGLGLGASLTTLHQMFESELHDYFGIPDDYGVVASIPIGFPQGNFGPVRRHPVASKAHYERWASAQ